MSTFAPHASRHARRTQLRDALKALATRGLSPQHGLWSVVAATRAVIDILTGRSPTRASDAGKRIVELFDQSLANNPSPQSVACQRGCAFCCYGFVSVTAPEIFLVARQIKAQHAADLPAFMADLRAKVGTTAGLDKVARHQRREPCAFLVDGACSVYAARPLACRAFASFSLERCEHAFKEGGEDIPVPGINLGLRAGSYQALWSALSYAGLPNTTYELTQGVLVALETPDAERRWLAGEDIFASVTRDADASALGETAEAKLRFEVIGAAAMGREPPQNPWL